MAYVLTTCCFDMDALSGHDLAEIVRHGLGFMPQKVRSPIFRGRFSDRLLRVLESELTVDQITVETASGPDGPLFRAQQIGSWSMQVVMWKTTTEYPEATFIDRISSFAGFNAAYVSDANDVFWQSEKEISNYDLFKRPHAHLRKRSDDTLGRLVVDTSGNPGRQSLFPGFYLLAAPRMWFNGSVFRYVSEARLRNFTAADRIEKLPSGAVFIELFGDIQAAALPVNRQRQESFRKWVGFDALEEQASDFATGRGDPIMEIVDEGGSRAITHYFDANGDPARRSKAAKSDRVVVDVSLGKK